MKKLIQKVFRNRNARKAIHMRIGANDKVKKQRILYPRAKVILGFGAALLAFVAITPMVFRSPNMLQVGTSSLLDAFSVVFESGQSNESLSIEGEVSWQGSFSNELPSEFDAEIGLTGDSATIVSNEGRTIGFTRDASIQEVMADIQGSLEQKGWTCIPSGQEFSATFAKDEGMYCWLAVTCTTVDDSTSVVLVPGKAEAYGEG